MLDAFIRNLSQDLELNEELHPLNNVYTIPLENDLSLTITSLETGFMMQAQITAVPPNNKERLYEHILHANLFGHGTRGAVLGLNEEGTILTLSKIVDYNIDYKGFKDSLEDFINMIDFWREEVHMFK